MASRPARQIIFLAAPFVQPLEQVFVNSALQQAGRVEGDCALSACLAVLGVRRAAHHVQAHCVLRANLLAEMLPISDTRAQMDGLFFAFHHLCLTPKLECSLSS